jgi:hypothetical protein
MIFSHPSGFQKHCAKDLFSVDSVESVDYVGSSFVYVLSILSSSSESEILVCF